MIKSSPLRETNSSPYFQKLLRKMPNYWRQVVSMSPSETELNSTVTTSKLEVLRKEGRDFVVKVQGMKTSLKIEDTFAEMCPLVETSPANSTTLFFLR